MALAQFTGAMPHWVLRRRSSAVRAASLALLAASILNFLARAFVQPGVLNKGLSYRERTQRNFFFGEDTAEVETKPLRDLNNLPPLDGGPDAAPNFASERTLLDVVRYPHPSLRRENALIERFDARLEQLVDNLFLTLYNEGDVIGLAAPQVGVNFVLWCTTHVPWIVIHLVTRQTMKLFSSTLGSSKRAARKS